MFRGELKYYHGTSTKVWEKIKADNMFKPSDVKDVQNYWITKGVYFVCENPYIALWYAHIAAVNDKSDPIVICVDYSVDPKKGDVLNLLTSDGHKVLNLAHNLFKEKLHGIEESYNLDSSSLYLLLKKSKTLKAVIAAFQEGESFQKIIHDHDYENRYVKGQSGMSPGDHIEICFFPDLALDSLELKELTKKDILEKNNPHCIWNNVCLSLNKSLPQGGFRNKVEKKLAS